MGKISLKKIGKCKICTEKGILIGHHLSYLPEKIIKICWQCHSILHWLARRSKKNRSQMIVQMMNLIDSYGKNWMPGQYSKSKRYQKYKKLYIPNWKKSENGKLSQKKYNHSELAKKSCHKYNLSPKAKERCQKYDSSVKGQSTRLNYRKSEHGRLIRQTHEQSEKVKAYRREYRREKRHDEIN
jgi:hypothetical protein